MKLTTTGFDPQSSPCSKRGSRPGPSKQFECMWQASLIRLQLTLGACCVVQCRIVYAIYPATRLLHSLSSLSLAKSVYVAARVEISGNRLHQSQREGPHFSRLSLCLPTANTCPYRDAGHTDLNSGPCTKAGWV